MVGVDFVSPTMVVVTSSGVLVWRASQISTHGMFCIVSITKLSNLESEVKSKEGEDRLGILGEELIFFSKSFLGI